MSSQVFAYTRRMDFRTLLEVECRGLTGFAPVIRDSLEDFHSMLTLFPDIDFLIIDGVTSDKELRPLLEALVPRQDSIRNILVLSNEPPVSLRGLKNFHPGKVNDLMNHLKALLKPSDSQEGFIAVPLDALVHFKFLPFDLYLKVGDKFLKRMYANEDIDKRLALEFKQRGVAELYFERKHNKDFTLMLLNNMINKLEADHASEEAMLKVATEVFQTTKEIVQSVGLAPKVIEVCESVMERITGDVIKGKDRLSSYLTSMKNGEGYSFQFRLVELTSFIATQILDTMNEPGVGEKIKTVVFAAFFCDISLKNSEHLYLRTDWSIKDLWPEDKRAVSEHALRSAEIVAKYKNAPAEASTIIKQHHGSLDGIGFPDLPSDPRLLQLAKVLHASQELAYTILTEPGNSTSVSVKKVVKKFEGSGLHEYLVFFEKSVGANL